MILVALAVLAMSAVAGVIAFRMDLRADMFNKQIVKLIGADNVERAKRLCGALPASIYVTATARAIEDAPTIAESAVSKEDLRGRLRDCFFAAFDELAKGQLALARLLGWLGMLSSVAVAAPVVLLAHRATLPAIAGLLGAGVGLFAVTRVARITASRERFDELAAALAQHYDSKRRVDDGAFRSSPAGAPAPEPPARNPEPAAQNLESILFADGAPAEPQSDAAAQAARLESILFSEADDTPSAPPKPRCSSCGATELSEVARDKLEQLRGTAPAGTEGLNARICRSCGHIDWYVDPARIDELTGDAKD